ncbi:protein HEG homolog 1 isoform X5 [Myotis myotis]|uniref:protein HEG homolog 1 isoform X5 n=1 Tax=Myotis myotis TaxID=51298 RepID=UPI00174D2D25|nr:protein HEG homolog 1 isoform X5 [Myotis myotis]
MASPRASRWPPPLPLLLLLLLPLLPPAAPRTRGQPSSPARGAPLAGAGLARPPEPSPEHELQAPPPTPPRARRGPAPPRPRRSAPAPDAAGPGGGSAAAVRNHWPEGSTEPHAANVTFDQNPVDFSTLASEEGVKVQTPDQSHAPSDAPENFTLHTETAAAGGTNPSRRRTKVPTAPAGPERATAPTSPSSTSASGSTEELNNSTAPQSPSVSWAKSVQVATTFPSGVPRVTQSVAVSAGQLNETEGFSEDAEVATTSASVHSSPSEAELRRNTGVTRSLGDGKFSESSTENGFGLTSSEVAVGFWQNDSPATEDSPELGVSADTQQGSEGTPGARAHSPHTSATFTGNGERTLRSVTNRTSGDEGRSQTAPGEAESATPHGNVTAAVTGMIYHPAGGTDTERRPPSHHTDHTYVSSTFTKGERALLSITDNSSAPDARESSTSSGKISNPSRSGDPPSSQAQTERSNGSSYAGAPPATESLGLRPAHLPFYTPAVNTSGTLDLLGTRTGSVSDSSPSSGPPLPPPSVSQPHQPLSSTLSSTRASAHPLESTPDAPTPLPSSPPPSPGSLTVPAPVSVSVSQATLSPSSLTLALPRARDTPVTPVRTATVASSVPMLSRSQTADPKNQSSPHHEHVATKSKPPSWESLPTEATGAETVSSASGIPVAPALTESFPEPTLPATSTRLARTPPAWTATTPRTPPPPVPTPGPSSSTATPMAGPAAVQTTAGKRFLPTSPEMPAPRISTEAVVTTKRSRAPVGDTTRWSSLTSAPTSATVLTTEPGVSEGDSPAPPFLRTTPSPWSTDASPAEVSSPLATTSRAQSGTQSPPARSSPASVNSCAPNPCLHDGKCVVDPARRGHRCVCSPSWQGEDCSVDVNECLSSPCPPLAVCNNTQGSFTCRCPIGYQLEKGICNLVRTFVTEFKLKKTFPNSTVEKHSDLHEVESEVTKTLNMCFSMLPGYTRSTVRASGESSAVVLSLQTTFSLASNVTLFDLADGMQRCANSCRSSAEVCQLLGSQRRIFRAGSLCKRKTPECDKETSVCTDLDGVALCQCKSGYFQFNKMDHSCRACEDGYRLENETCMSCPFGLGGLNCGNPYQLITVVIAAAGGGLLLILGIALIVTCCRKNKNDISKLIFKSGDFQMSPYAEYPKNPRSQEWGREAIEMHENGSTKNLLQMTDVYYSPTSVRNPELERNGLYPAYTGLPGSRHSCIFPGQYNPSFISDESRRRDYF